MQDSISAFKRWEGTVQLLSLGPQANRISLGLSRCKARIILCCRAPNCSPSCILCSSSHHSAHCFTFPFAQRPAHVRCRGGERSPGPPAFIPRLRPLCSHTSSAAPHHGRRPRPEKEWRAEGRWRPHRAGALGSQRQPRAPESRNGGGWKGELGSS